jgi:uncharacterized membrane protein YccC
VEPPDNVEKGIRFGCGAIVGAGIAITSTIAWSLVKGWYFVAFIVFWAGVCGFAAMKHGDRFWENLRDYRWW